MRRRRTTVVALVLALSMFLALPAQALTLYGATTGYIVYNPSGTVVCNNPNHTFRIKSYTYGFGPFDSTGNTIMRITSGGVNYDHHWIGAEHDGTTKTWNTNRKTATYFHVYYQNLWVDGEARVDIYCA